MKNTTQVSRKFSILTNLLYFFSIFIFINAFNFQHNPPGAWRGLKLSNCEDALLRNTVFENISPHPVDSTYAVELTDCGIPES
ncbi:MAG: hypothetical protein K1X85_06005 [Ignavibacteria bacterium]|nr:hypothetical protein [Ignavibacteria bacterium]